MRETQFIEQNQEKWASFEQMLHSGQLDPEQLHDLYVQINDDLSFARTFYPNRSVRFYLNRLAQRIFHQIHRGRKNKRGRWMDFWTAEIPQIMWECRKSLQLSFAIFVFAMLIGIVSSRIDPDFARIILGDNYVEMTLRNIERGDPMAVYKDRNAYGMSLGIAFNNIFVALMTAVMGVLAAFGTIFLLLSNGVMVGVFQYFFVQKGLFWESFLTIWIHGTLEISAIIVAGAAGLTAGSGLLFPGTYTRVQAFQLSVRRGMKMFLGLIPIFFLAAFFEGFLTRFTETPDVIRALFILSSLFFVLWYFVFFPKMKAKQGFSQPIHEKELPPDREFGIPFWKIKNAGEIFSDLITVLKHRPKPMILGIFSATLIFMISVFGFSEDEFETAFQYGFEMLGVLDAVPTFFWHEKLHYLLPLQVVLLSFLAWLAFRTVERELPAALQTQLPNFHRWVSFFLFVVPTTLLVFIFKISTSETTLWLLMIPASAFLPLFAYVLYRETFNPVTALLRSIQLFEWRTALAVGFLLTNMTIMLFVLLDSQFFLFLLNLLSWNVASGEDNIRQFIQIALTFFAALMLYFVFWMSMVAGAIQYFSFVEISDASSLLEKIEQIGTTQQIRGLEKE